MGVDNKPALLRVAENQNQQHTAESNKYAETE